MERADPLPAREALPYMRQLDGVRAVAIAGVLFQHLLEGSAKVFPAGAIGVRVFFVLSGFLITGILLRARPEDERTSVRQALRTFYARRILRIAPLFYLALAVVAALNVADVRGRFWWHATYLSNYYFAAYGQTHLPDAHLWSLAVEEQFYLVWPAVIFLTPRRLLVPAILLTISCGPVFRAGVSLLHWRGAAVWAPTPGCLDSLGAGALLALCADPSRGVTHLRRPLIRICRYVGIPLLAFVLLLHGLDVLVGVRRIFFDLAIAMAGVALVDATSRGFDGMVGRLLSAGPVVYAGVISYGIYVWHPFVAHYVRAAWCPEADFSNPRFYASAVVTLVVSFAIASLSWFLFERPITRLKRHFDYGIPTRQTFTDVRE